MKLLLFLSLLTLFSCGKATIQDTDLDPLTYNGARDPDSARGSILITKAWCQHTVKNLDADIIELEYERFDFDEAGSVESTQGLRTGEEFLAEYHMPRLKSLFRWKLEDEYLKVLDVKNEVSRTFKILDYIRSSEGIKLKILYANKEMNWFSC